MRARVTYYHQVGYYAMHVKEQHERRLELAPYYADILTGHSWMHVLSSVSEIEAGMSVRRYSTTNGRPQTWRQKQISATRTPYPPATRVSPKKLNLPPRA